MGTLSKAGISIVGGKIVKQAADKPADEKPVESKAAPSAPSKSTNALAKLSLGSAASQSSQAEPMSASAAEVERAVNETALPEAVPLPEGRAGVQARLERLDQMLVGDRYAPAQIPLVKNYVAHVAKELASHPEYAEVLLDVHVHNIMVFMHQTAHDMSDKKVVSKTKRAAKAVRESAFDAAFDLGAMQEAMALPEDGSMPSLESFAAADTSKIKPKNR